MTGIEEIQSRIVAFLAEHGHSASETAKWEAKVNGQLILRLRGICVNVYPTKRTVLWQGINGSLYQKAFATWTPPVSKQSTTRSATVSLSKASVPTCSPSHEPPCPIPLNSTSSEKTHPARRRVGRPKLVRKSEGNVPLSSNDPQPIGYPKSQKSSQAECDAFLREVEGKTGDPSSWWMEKTTPNTLRIASLHNVGRGTLSFYTRKGTLLAHGADAQQINQRFLDWRRDRLRLMEPEPESSPPSPKTRPQRKSAAKAEIAREKIAFLLNIKRRPAATRTEGRSPTASDSHDGSDSDDIDLGQLQKAWTHQPVNKQVKCASKVRIAPVKNKFDKGKDAKPSSQVQAPKRAPSKPQQEKPLPPDWEQHWSDQFGVPYYWNKITKASMWVRPK